MRSNFLTTFVFLCQSSVAYARSKCQDSPGSIVVYGDNDGNTISVNVKSCSDVRAETTLCANGGLKHFCPVTCGTCDPDQDTLTSTCEIDLDLKFPKRRPDIGSFYGSDTMLVKKQGPSGSTHDVCSSFNGATQWGCTHEGEALVNFNQHIVGNFAAMRIDEENVRITNAAGSKFRVQVRHNFTKEEVDQPPQSSRRDARSRLVVTVNGNKRTRRRFRPKKNYYVPTHTVPDLFETMDFGLEVEEPKTEATSEIDMPELAREFNPNDIPLPGEDWSGEGGEVYDPDESGYINPEYEGSFFVDIMCNDSCRCKMKRRSPKCEITAKLLPGSNNWNRTEHLTVRKEGETNVAPCSKKNRESWWCAHYGEAMATEVMPSDYIIVSHQAEAVKIPNAVSSTYVFTVSRDIPPPIDDTPFSLMIYTPKQTYGPLSGIEAGASFYTNSWGLSCDNNCNCDRPYLMPSLA